MYCYERQYYNNGSFKKWKVAPLLSPIISLYISVVLFCFPFLIGYEKQKPKKLLAAPNKDLALFSWGPFSSPEPLVPLVPRPARPSHEEQVPPGIHVLIYHNLPLEKISFA